MSSTYAQHALYKNVFSSPVSADENSQVVLCADFDNIQFYLDVLSGGSPDFDVQLFISNQDLTNPPDPSIDSSSTNQYDQVMYSDQAGGVNYDAEHPYNPSAGITEHSFKALPKGAVWCFLRIANYSAGTLTKADINLFNND